MNVGMLVCMPPSQFLEAKHKQKHTKSIDEPMCPPKSIDPVLDQGSPGSPARLVGPSKCVGMCVNMWVSLWVCMCVHQSIHVPRHHEDAIRSAAGPNRRGHSKPRQPSQAGWAQAAQAAQRQPRQANHQACTQTGLADRALHQQAQPSQARHGMAYGIPRHKTLKILDFQKIPIHHHNSAAAPGSVGRPL